MAEDAKCVACESSVRWYIGQLLAFVFALIGCGLAYAYQKRLIAYYEAKEEQIIDFSQRFTLLFITMQILELLGENRMTVGGAEMPDPFRGFLNLFSFVALDFIEFIPSSCAMGKMLNHFEGLLIFTTVPIALFLLTACACGGWSYYQISRGKKAKKRFIESKTFKDLCIHFLYGMVFLLPAISKTICQSFR